MLRIKLYDGVEKEVKVYNAKAILNLDVQFFIEECDDDLDVDEVDFDFPGYVSSYFRIYNERLGRLIKTIALTNNGGSLIINASVLDMTFNNVGVYSYEIGYVTTGGYEQMLAHGKLTVV